MELPSTLHGRFIVRKSVSRGERVMGRQVRAWLAGAVLWAGLASVGSAQPTAAPSAAAPCAASPVAAPDPWQLMAPVSDADLAPPPDAACEDNNGTLLHGDPFLDPSRHPAPGFFASAEANILVPSFNNRLQGPVTVPGLGSMMVIVPTATLPWTVSPEFRIGYRLPQGFGSFALTYRFLFDQGTSGTPGVVSTGQPNIVALLGLTPPAPTLPTGPGGITSRLNVNIIGIDYQTEEYSLGPNWDIRFTAGAWIVTNYFDSRIAGTLLEERVSSNEVGAGPHVGLELWRWLSGQPGHGLALYGKTEGAITFGRVQQNFEANVLGPGGVPIVGGANKLTSDPFAVPGNGGNQYAPILRTQFGVTWAPGWANDRLRCSGGYDFQGWWWVGRLPGPTGNSNTLGSGSTMITNGVFLRAEWKY
jgi:hypothetical protein